MVEREHPQKENPVAAAFQELERYTASAPIIQTFREYADLDRAKAGYVGEHLTILAPALEPSGGTSLVLTTIEGVVSNDKLRLGIFFQSFDPAVLGENPTTNGIATSSSLQSTLDASSQELQTFEQDPYLKSFLDQVEEMERAGYWDNEDALEDEAEYVEEEDTLAFLTIETGYDISPSSEQGIQQFTIETGIPKTIDPTSSQVRWALRVATRFGELMSDHIDKYGLPPAPELDQETTERGIQKVIEQMQQESERLRNRGFDIDIRGNNEGEENQ